MAVKPIPDPEVSGGDGGHGKRFTGATEERRRTEDNADKARLRRAE